MQLEVPDPCLYADFRRWLTVLVERNAAQHQWFSRRWLAAKVKWPPSLVSEVLSGKRQVTVRRALELAKFLRLSTVATERLVSLSLAHHEDLEVAKYFAQVVARKRSGKKTVPSRQATETPGFFLVYAIAAFMENAPTRAFTIAELRLYLRTCQHHPEEDFVRALAQLVKEKKITRSPTGYRWRQGVVGGDRIPARESGASERLRFTEEVCQSIVQYQRQAMNPAQRRIYRMLLEPLRPSALSEILERWEEIANIVADASEPSSHSTEDRELFQICFFAFPIAEIP